ncbi:MAG: type II secretion system minor pseudopilin GspJ [Venatoribacter sp.]
MKQRGFTLLEVLIAVSITALIGVGAVQLLSNIIDSRRATEIRSEQLASLQRFNMVVARDLEQIINRTVRDEFGNAKPALVLDGAEYLIEFTRAGWRNSPFSESPRSELQRVAYRLESLDSSACEIAKQRLQSWGINDSKGECLVRYFWPVLDQSNHSQPISQVLLEQVDGLEIDVLAGAPSVDELNPAASKGEWYSQWPALEMGTTSHPKAIRWRIRLPNLGEIERLWLVAWGEW